MELSFENKTVNAFHEAAHSVKTVQETAETVVPDINDDVGKIVSVRTNILLKSKENTARGVCVEGEAEAAVLYITESAEAVSFVKLSKKFTIDFDVPDMPEEAQSRIMLSLADTQARVINPRKLSVTFSVTGEVSVYTRENVISCTLLPENIAEKGIHVKSEKSEFTMVAAAAERTFAVSEQFTFPAGKSVPAKLISERAEFLINDTQVIGTKAIARGEMKVEVVYLSDDAACPMKAEFSTPFSQIIETGEEQTELCVSTVEICSQYFELIDAVNGEKMLNTEIHAVLQVTCYSKVECSYIADAYCNLLPCICSRQSVRLTEQMQILKTRLVSDEKIMLPEDCADILSILPAASQPTFDNGTLRGDVVMDIVYRSSQGELCSARKTVCVQGECEGRNIRLISWHLTDVYLRTDGGLIDSHAAVEIQYQNEKYTERSSVTGLELDDEAPYDFSSFPTVTIVRAEGNELWEYARKYHSSVEEIEAVNGREENYTGKLLLIPKGV